MNTTLLESSALRPASMAGKPVMILTNVSSLSEAEALTQTLLEEQLAACVSTWPITSTYVWKGKVNKSQEIQLLIKSTSMLVESLMKRILELHPYETPELLELQVSSWSRAYGSWIQDTTRAAPKA